MNERSMKVLEQSLEHNNLLMISSQASIHMTSFFVNQFT